MRISIDSIIEFDNSTYGVTAHLDNGFVKGIWRSNEIPSVGETYDVELSFPPVKLEKIDETVSSVIIINSDIVEFKGLCEEIDEDIYVIRFDINWFEMIEKVNLNIIIGDFVKFELRYTNIFIYPVGY